ncbi:MAG TPA: hypothetical protein VK028_05200 [Micromonosporaceae bacterium]|nr:hypothetical protein [Micromonosporaceae bacterium]
MSDQRPSNHQHVVFDDTAMVAAARGSRIASRLIERAHSADDITLYATTCALVEAERAHPGTAEHVASLPGFNILDLDLSAALAVAQEDTWAIAHTRYAAAPTLDRPDGALVATADPSRWAGQAVRVIDLRST